jgi:hypothetical protein
LVVDHEVRCFPRSSRKPLHFRHMSSHCIGCRQVPQWEGEWLYGHKTSKPAGTSFDWAKRLQVQREKEPQLLHQFGWKRHRWRRSDECLRTR